MAATPGNYRQPHRGKIRNNRAIIGPRARGPNKGPGAQKIRGAGQDHGAEAVGNSSHGPDNEAGAQHYGLVIGTLPHSLALCPMAPPNGVALRPGHMALGFLRRAKRFGLLRPPIGLIFIILHIPRRDLTDPWNGFGLKKLRP